MINCPKTVLMVALSATMSNVGEIKQWVQHTHGPSSLVVSDFRPVPLTYAIFHYFPFTTFFALFFRCRCPRFPLHHIINSRFTVLDLVPSIRPPPHPSTSSPSKKESKIFEYDNFCSSAVVLVLVSTFFLCPFKYSSAPEAVFRSDNR